MKYFLNKILVVEGKEDASYLSSFLEAEFVTTKGYELPAEDIDYLNHAYKNKGIIVLVDPDLAGRQIEGKLKGKLLSATYLNVDLSRCTRGKKTGIAECDKEEILRVLRPYLEEKKYENKPFLQGNSLKIMISDKELRKYICNKYHLGKCNSKTLFKRIDTMGIDEKDLMKTVEEYQSGN